jgi:hypothetical protein
LKLPPNFLVFFEFFQQLDTQVVDGNVVDDSQRIVGCLVALIESNVGVKLQEDEDLVDFLPILEIGQDKVRGVFVTAISKRRDSLELQQNTMNQWPID